MDIFIFWKQFHSMACVSCHSAFFCRGDTDQIICILRIWLTKKASMTILFFSVIELGEVRVVGQMMQREMGKWKARRSDKRDFFIGIFLFDIFPSVASARSNVSAAPSTETLMSRLFHNAVILPCGPVFVQGGSYSCMMH